MFLPTAGSAAAAQAAAVASVTQQQLQLQTAAATAAHINSINNVAAAAQVKTNVSLCKVFWTTLKQNIGSMLSSNVLSGTPFRVVNYFKLLR